MAQYPGVIYFDATGALPRSGQILLNVEPSSPFALRRVNYVLENQRPEIVLFGNRLFYFANEVLAALETGSYIHIGGGAYAKAKIVDNRSHRSVDIRALCGPDNYPDSSVYVGNHFMKMELVTNPDTLIEAAPYDLVACTRYAPIRFSEGKSFAEIFDYDRQY